MYQLLYFLLLTIWGPGLYSVLCLVAAVVFVTPSSSWSKPALAVVTNRPLILKCEVRVFLSPATSPPEVVRYPSHYSLEYLGLDLSHAFLPLTNKEISLAVYTGHWVCLSVLLLAHCTEPVHGPSGAQRGQGVEFYWVLRGCGIGTCGKQH